MYGLLCSQTYHNYDQTGDPIISLYCKCIFNVGKYFKDHLIKGTISTFMTIRACIRGPI